jgi:Zn-dependent peptidase ImmA (M78 family)
MTRTLEHFGAVVTIFEGVSDKIDAFSYYRTRPIIVRNLIKHSPSRARFDLAHECGHIVMHSNADVGSPHLEEQANNFASAFLLPRTGFAQEFPKGPRLNWTKIFGLKKRWGVSVQAIIKRAYDLNLISAVQYRNAYVHISRNGWRHREPLEPVPESMEIIPTAFNLLKQHRHRTASQIASNLKLKCDILSRFGITCEDSDANNQLGEEIEIQEHPLKRIKLTFN